MSDALRPLAVLSPRGQSYGDGPNDFQVNRTAFGAGIAPGVGDGWTLALTGGPAPVSLSRADLMAMGLHTATLPIACVEGWSVSAHWSGVRIRDLLAAVGAPADAAVRVTSLEPEGVYRVTELPSEFVRHPTTLVALGLNGETLNLDHGYPARLIAPNRPGVLQTKWLSRLEVLA